METWAWECHFILFNLYFYASEIITIIVSYIWCDSQFWVLLALILIIYLWDKDVGSDFVLSFYQGKREISLVKKREWSLENSYCTQINPILAMVTLHNAEEKWKLPFIFFLSSLMGKIELMMKRDIIISRHEKFMYSCSYFFLVLCYFFHVISYLKCYINWHVFFFIHIILTYSYIHVFILIFILYFFIKF